MTIVRNLKKSDLKISGRREAKAYKSKPKKNLDFSPNKTYKENMTFKKEFKKDSANRNIHDLLFKTVYSKPKYSLDIFKLCLSPKEYSLFDWSTLQSEVNTFVDKEWQEKRADLIFSIQLKNSKLKAKIIFLLEHKSRQDSSLMRQLLHYQAGIYEKTTSPVIAVLFYHGQKKKWGGALSFHASLQFPELLKKYFAENVLNFKVRFVNLQDLDEKRFKKPDLTSGVIFYIMAHVWNLDETKLREFFRLTRKLDKKEKADLIELAVSYIRQADPHFTWDILQEIENQTLKKEERNMALLPGTIEFERKEALREGLKKGRMEGIEKGRMEGIEKGMEKGRMEGMELIAIKMLNENLDIPFISKITGLSAKKISKLKH